MTRRRWPAVTGLASNGTPAASARCPAGSPGRSALAASPAQRAWHSGSRRGRQVWDGPQLPVAGPRRHPGVHSHHALRQSAQGHPGTRALHLAAKRGCVPLPSRPAPTPPLQHARHTTGPLSSAQRQAASPVRPARTALLPGPSARCTARGRWSWSRRHRDGWRGSWERDGWSSGRSTWRAPSDWRRSCMVSDGPASTGDAAFKRIIFPLPLETILPQR